MSEPRRIVLTGGPGGGKTTLMEELRREPRYAGRFLFLPETVFAVGSVGIPGTQKQFQRLMVHAQLGLEAALAQTLEPGDGRIILCHRGSLDPLAYWLDRGWSEDEFFEYTRSRIEEHYARYAAVIHLVTSADGAEHAYRRVPLAQRGETVEQAIRLDRLLQRVWSGHPRYDCIDNIDRDWDAKSRQAREILEQFLHS